jgi:hypothetical protein
MTTEVLTLVLTAATQSTAGQGRMFYVKSATGALSITCDIKGTGATIRKFVNIGAGFKFVAPEDKGWTYLRILSATTQNIELIVGDDDVEVANAVSVTGSVSVTDTPASTVVNQGSVALPNAAQTPLCPANASRRRITVCNPSTAAGSFFLRSSAGTANLLEVQPGTFVELRGTYALDARNDSGGALSALLFEET